MQRLWQLHPVQGSHRRCMLSAAAPALFYADIEPQSASIKNVQRPQACHCLQLSPAHHSQACCLQAVKCSFVPLSSLKLPHLDHTTCLIPATMGAHALAQVHGTTPAPGASHAESFVTLHGSRMQPRKPLTRPCQQGSPFAEAGAVPAGVEAEPCAAGSDTHVAPGAPAPDAGTV